MGLLRKYSLGFDVYERHHIVSRILNQSKSENVIDAGRIAGMLQMFSKTAGSCREY